MPDRDKPLFILNGPNLNLLGVREPEIYGRATLADVKAVCERAAGARAIDFRQTNHEGVLIDWLHEAREKAAAIILNPGAYAHTSIALRDAVSALPVPLIEVHLSNIAAREPFRHHSHVAGVAKGVVMGFGAESYALAIAAALRLEGAVS
ncbi:MAG: type II 3-dehydroquinate dehydratase [Hyphomonadaceae bacterium]|nr:type II 3-dehydroquinate dehydratase [Hyphomonadaceae bacterium]